MRAQLATPPGPARVLIVDLSNNNGAADFRRLKAYGVSAVWLKVTEGTTFVDVDYRRFRSQATAAGLRVGGYHFCEPAAGAAEHEARQFVSRLGPIGRRDLRPVLDLEVTHELRAPAALEAYARLLVAHVWDATGVCPIVYSYPSYLEALRLHRTIGCGLWLASYGRDDGREHPYTVPAPWKKAQAHQFTSRARLPGVAGGCDVSSAPSLRPLLAHPWTGML